jgi:outer membrane protein TolC
MVGPDFVKPEAPVETEWMEARDPQIKTEPSDYKEWWAVFNDPVLNSLVETAYRFPAFESFRPGPSWA